MEPTGPLALNVSCIALPAPIVRFSPPSRFSNQPVFFIAYQSFTMTNNQSNIRRFKMTLEKTKPRQVTTDPLMAPVCNLSLHIDPLDPGTRKQSQESSPALIPEFASSPRASTDLGRLARFKNLLPFNWSNRNIASSSVGVSASVQTQPPRALRK